MSGHDSLFELASSLSTLSTKLKEQAEELSATASKLETEAANIAAERTALISQMGYPNIAIAISGFPGRPGYAANGGNFPGIGGHHCAAIAGSGVAAGGAEEGGENK